jgi:histidine triad (HIT) family protein
MKKAMLVVAITFFFAAGFLVGAAAIHRPMPNAPLELPPARSPWNSKDALGLIGSAGIRTLAGHLVTVPLVVLETDRTFALKIPTTEPKRHFVVVPKKDIRDISQVSADDGAYLIDAFLTARHLVEKEGLREYRIYTNGQGLQSVGYLHFHVIGRKTPS